MTIKEQVNQYKDEMIAQIGRLVQYNSVEGTPEPDMPFGKEPAAVLKEALGIAEELGFKTVNLDNYCGYAEFGTGDEIIGIAGHLDIVPVGDGWHYDPFKVTVEGDKFYGRGTCDDKGPVIMSLYAMKIIRDLKIPVNKRIRLIMGTNEETGSKCMKHYNEVAEPLTLGFTPDGEFPCIYGEKGHMSLEVKSKNTKIISMNGGFVSNAVCHQCTTVIPTGIVTKEALEKALSDTPLVSFTVTEDSDTFIIFAEGVAAHASTPLLGINAAGCTMEALAASGFNDDFVTYYNSHVGTKCDGSGYGIDFTDNYGDLSFNNGLVSTKDGVITLNIDIRVPVTVKKEELIAACTPYLEDDMGKTEILSIGEPLFFPRESDLVNALYAAYETVSGDTKNEPMVIGGGTYAKYLPGIIAFGAEHPGIDYRIHNADEFYRISDMLLTTEIYVKAIENLLEI